MTRNSESEKQLKRTLDLVIASLIEEGVSPWHIQDSAERYVRLNRKHPHITEAKKKIARYLIRLIVKIGG